MKDVLLDAPARPRDRGRASTIASAGARGRCAAARRNWPSRLGFQAHVVPAADGRRRGGLLERDPRGAPAGRRRRCRPLPRPALLDRRHGARGGRPGTHARLSRPRTWLRIASCWSPRGSTGGLAHVDGVAHPAVVNIGVRPTFARDHLSHRGASARLLGRSLRSRRCGWTSCSASARRCDFPRSTSSGPRSPGTSAAARAGLPGR